MTRLPSFTRSWFYVYLQCTAWKLRDMYVYFLFYYFFLLDKFVCLSAALA